MKIGINFRGTGGRGFDDRGWNPNPCQDFTDSVNQSVNALRPCCRWF